MNGTLIAADFADFWNQANPAAVNVDQFGNTNSSDMVWTGSTGTSFGFTGLELGSISVNGTRHGDPNTTDFRWMSDANLATSNDLPLYALNEKRTVPILIPAPASWVGGLWLAAVGLACYRLSRRGCHG